MNKNNFESQSTLDMPSVVLGFVIGIVVLVVLNILF